ncbi:hypothetical protein GTO27_12035 [Candidatus Bathyarchaeota archaeon]|nr:hypothetical protein [Candidatus Bathyarchaeota archaeon]
MSSKGIQRKQGRERLQGIIETCRSVEEYSLDPFLIDIDEIIRIIKEYFPAWEHPEDLCLDAETINQLASVIGLQSEWVKQRSTSLYTDPFLLEEKLVRISKDEIIKIFLQAWHPIVALEQISLRSLTEALNYWRGLPPLNDRWKELWPERVESEPATRDELIMQRILGDKEFSVELENFWQRLKIEVEERGKDNKIKYWDFIGAETYTETVHKAFMTSFLITYGYATLEIRPLEEEIYVRPFRKPSTEVRDGQLISIPIAVTVEEWRRWRTGEPE